MNSKMIRSAVFAATRAVRDGKQFVDAPQEIRQAHITLFDTEPDETETKQLHDTADLVGDLINFADAIASRKWDGRR